MDIGPARRTAIPADNTNAMSSKKEMGFKNKSLNRSFIVGVVHPGLIWDFAPPEHLSE
jgi:hypothetical protein